MDERELLLLGLLLRQDMHGYELNHFLEHRLDSLFALNRSTAYYLLGRLAQRGLVDAELERHGRRPERRVFRLTEEGQDAFQGALREHLAGYSPGGYPDEVGLLFLEMLPRDEQRQLLQEKLKVVGEQRQRAQERRDIHSGSPVRWMLSHRLAQLETEERWLSDLIAELAGSEKPVVDQGKT
jgi:DNA-binding PadR family transcriptional regulator